MNSTQSTSSSSLRPDSTPPSAESESGAGRPIRVLHVVESWLPVVSGYTSRSARIVAAQAAHPGMEPHVAVSTRQHMYLGTQSAVMLTADHGPLAGVPVSVARSSTLERAMRRVRRFSVDASSFGRWLTHEIVRLRPDVVHVHWSSSIGAQAVSIGHRHGIPVVCEVRFDLAGAMTAQSAGGRLRPLERPLRKHFERHLPHADAVIAASHSLGRLVEVQTGEPPIIVENAVEPPERSDDLDLAARGRLRARHGVDDDTVLVGAVSKLLAYEGFERMIDSCARLRASGTDVRPVLVGGGPEWSMLIDRATAAGVDLIAPGIVDSDEVGDWYAALDITVVPRLDVSVTRYAAPLKVLEAMTYGAAVIASDVGDIAMLLEDGRGRTIEPKNDEALDHAIRGLAGDPDERLRMRTTAKQWTLDQPGWERTANQLQEVYLATIRRRHSPGRDEDSGRVHRPAADARIGPEGDDRNGRLARVAGDEADNGNLVIVGAGPAGLTAALDASRRTGLHPIVLEASDMMGGISRTVSHNGNLIDIGGHRFFSRSDRVTDWWLDVLPIERGATWRASDPIDGPDPHLDDEVMLVRSRSSQILWNGRLFDYPLDLSIGLLRKLGARRTIRAGFSYVRAQLFPIANEDNLEDFYINRFGRELYRTFFESYTEKVWGVPCREISPDWGAQRVKGLSLWAALRHALTPKRRDGGAQRDVETSLVEKFLYPKFGPGQMWETVASKVLDSGGEVLTGVVVKGFDIDDPPGEEPTVRNVRALDRATGDEIVIPATHVVSTMPLNLLVGALGEHVSDNAREIADGLRFRDFITVGILVDNLRLTEPDGRALGDNWLYIQEPDVLVGRLQIFNNWSPWMVADPGRTWVGLEYFCSHTDAMWSWTDQRLVHLAGEELTSIGIIEPGAVLDGCVLRVRRAYPSYIGTYDRLGELQPELTRFENLWCAGRNGQHRYNNQDHSMLASMIAIDQIATGERRSDDVWSVNIDDDYHEDG